MRTFNRELAEGMGDDGKKGGRRRRKEGPSKMDLKDALRKLDLATSGTKIQLMERLKQSGKFDEMFPDDGEA